MIRKRELNRANETVRSQHETQSATRKRHKRGWSGVHQDREIIKESKAREMRQFRSGAVVFHKARGDAALNGPPRAHCAHCRGSCLAHKHASKPSTESPENDEWPKPDRLHMHVRQPRYNERRAYFLVRRSLLGLLKNVSPSLCLGGNPRRFMSIEVDGKRVLINGHRRNYRIFRRFPKVVSLSLKSRKYPLFPWGFPVVGWVYWIAGHEIWIVVGVRGVSKFAS